MTCSILSHYQKNGGNILKVKTPPGPTNLSTLDSGIGFGCPQNPPLLSATPTTTQKCSAPPLRPPPSARPLQLPLSALHLQPQPSERRPRRRLAPFRNLTILYPVSQQPQQQQTSTFRTPQSSRPSGLSTPFAATQAQSSPFAQAAATPALPFGNAQLTTQMAPVAPLPFSLADRDIQDVLDAYKEEPENPNYTFKHLLFNVTEPQYRVKPVGVSDIMWAEAMGKLEGMESSDRERLWPHHVQGFKDLSLHLKLQDEVILADSERLGITQSNAKMLQRYFQAGTFPWIERMIQKEQGLQRRLLRVIRIIEALESKGCRLPLMKGEAELAEKLAAITRHLKGSGAELSTRVQNLLMLSCVQANCLCGGFVYIPGSTKIHEQSLLDMQEVLQQLTEAIRRLGNVLKRDMRDTEIIMAEETDMSKD